MNNQHIENPKDQHIEEDISKMVADFEERLKRSSRFYMHSTVQLAEERMRQQVESSLTPDGQTVQGGGDNTAKNLVTQWLRKKVSSQPDIETSSSHDADQEPVIIEGEFRDIGDDE